MCAGTGSPRSRVCGQAVLLGWLRAHASHRGGGFAPVTVVRRRQSHAHVVGLGLDVAHRRPRVPGHLHPQCHHCQRHQLLHLRHQDQHAVRRHGVRQVAGGSHYRADAAGAAAHGGRRAVPHVRKRGHEPRAHRRPLPVPRHKLLRLPHRRGGRPNPGLDRHHRAGVLGRRRAGRRRRGAAWAQPVHLPPPCQATARGWPRLEDRSPQLVDVRRAPPEFPCTRDGHGGCHRYVVVCAAVPCVGGACLSPTFPTVVQWALATSPTSTAPCCRSRR